MIHMYKLAQTMFSQIFCIYCTKYFNRHVKFENAGLFSRKKKQNMASQLAASFWLSTWVMGKPPAIPALICTYHIITSECSHGYYSIILIDWNAHPRKVSYGLKFQKYMRNIS